MASGKQKSPRNGHQEEKTKNLIERESTKRHVYIESGAQLDFVQSVKEKYESIQAEGTRLSGQQLRWTKISAALILVYALITLWQGFLTRTVIMDARGHFATDQRPYLWKSALVLHQPEPNDRIYADMFFADYGKSPAVGRKGRGKIFFGPKAMQKAEEWFRNFESEHISDEIGSEDIVPPGIPTDPKNPSGAYTSLASDDIPTADDVRYIQQNNEGVVIVDRELYSDISGNTYFSDICSSTLKTGAIGSCRHHSQIH